MTTLHAPPWNRGLPPPGAADLMGQTQPVPGKLLAPLGTAGRAEHPNLPQSSGVGAGHSPAWGDGAPQPLPKCFKAPLYRRQVEPARSGDPPSWAAAAGRERSLTDAKELDKAPPGQLRWAQACWGFESWPRKGQGRGSTVSFPSCSAVVSWVQVAMPSAGLRGRRHTG